MNDIVKTRHAINKIGAMTIGRASPWQHVVFSERCHGNPWFSQSCAFTAVDSGSLVFSSSAAALLWWRTQTPHEHCP